MNLTLSVSETVQELGIFQELTPAEIDSLSDGIFVREVPTGTVLYRPEDEGREIYVLIEGQVDLYRLTPRGKRLVTGRVRPGAIVGEMALLGHVPRGGFAEAIEDSRVCVVNRECMHRIISLHPEVAERILLATYAHLEELKQRLEHASFSSVKVRLAHFLRVNMDRATGDISGFTHADI
jgi:CRP-like cAMP-binding protein